MQARETGLFMRRLTLRQLDLLLTHRKSLTQGNAGVRKAHVASPWAKQSAGPLARRTNPGRVTDFRARTVSSDGRTCTRKSGFQGSETRQEFRREREPPKALATVATAQETRYGLSVRVFWTRSLITMAVMVAV